ncbi:MAG: M15 family metallopeptidase [Lachnospiraceae bacterium]|nr:M15 family metallopeptidase [Lachnospiraceae bacterium]
MKKAAAIVMVFVVMLSLAACAGKKQDAEPGAESGSEEVTGSEDISGSEEITESETEVSKIDYLVLVNRHNPLPEGWEDELETVEIVDSQGWDVEVEKTAYDAYLDLKADLEKEGVYVDLDSARRSVAEQQRIWDDFMEKYGEEYTKKTVAVPGFSEHQTGLALDLYLNVDGEDIYENEDMVQYTEIWAKIHAKLAEHGFILRYLRGMEDVTGYGYEPWHIRYVGVEAAKEIMSKGITLEEYLGKVPDTAAAVDYGTSEIYSDGDIKEAFLIVKGTISDWDGCELHKVNYAGDACNSADNIKWMNELGKGKNYAQCIEILADFHSPAAEEGTTVFEPDREYEGYQFWLAREEGGEWELLTWGY